MQQLPHGFRTRSTGVSLASRPVSSLVIVAFVVLLLISAGAAPVYSQWELGASAGAGLSVLNGEDWRNDLAFDNAEEHPAPGVRAALDAGYRFLPWLAGRLSFSALRAASRYDYIDELDGETHEYDGSLVWWSGGPGAHVELRIPLTPVEPFLSVGAIGAFPLSRFVRKDISEDVSIVRRVAAERAIALHVAGMTGVRVPAGAITVLIGAHYERSLTGYFETSGWPRLYANVITLNAGVEIPLEGAR